LQLTQEAEEETGKVQLRKKQFQLFLYSLHQLSGTLVENELPAVEVGKPDIIDST
jgi:hypothetical protein